MTRVKQFADDLGISKNQAKNLINKGRSRKDGGSQILESVMSDKDTDKKKKKKKEKKSRTAEYRIEMDGANLDGLTPVKPKRYNPKDDKDSDYGDPILMSKGGSKVTKINKGISGKAKVAQFKNIQNDVSAGKITQGEAEKKIREIVLSKKAGGTYKRKDGGGFPDLTGDGKVTKKDILKGRGVPGFSRGGGMAIQGLGFKGVK